MNLFWDRVGGLSEVDTLAVQALADVATIGILRERAIRESDVLRQQLQHSLNSRVMIEQAKGVVAYVNDVHMGEAFTLLRDYARSHGIPLAEVAEQIVNRRLKIYVGEPDPDIGPSKVALIRRVISSGGVD